MTARAYIVDGQGARAVDRDAAVVGLAAANPASDLVWVHFDAIDGEAGAWLDAHGDLPPSITTALVATETRPRFEAYDEGVLLNLRGPEAHDAQSDDVLSSIRIWGAKGRIFSVSVHDLSALAAVERALTTGRIVDPGEFIAALAGAITAQLDPDVAALGDLIDDCEENFDTRDPLDLRRTIAAARAKAIGYRRFVAPQRGALEALAALDAGWLGQDDRLRLKNVADRAARMAEELDSIRDRAALVQEQLSELRGERMSRHGLLLSVVSLVFLPITFITGLLGMNVEGIPFKDHPSAFAVVCTLCAVAAGALAAYFIRRRWFS